MYNDGSTSVDECGRSFGPGMHFYDVVVVTTSIVTAAVVLS